MILGRSEGLFHLDGLKKSAQRHRVGNQKKISANHFLSVDEFRLDANDFFTTSSIPCVMLESKAPAMSNTKVGTEIKSSIPKNSRSSALK